MYDMKRNISPLAILFIASVALGAYHYDPSRTQVSAVTGAVLGAAVAAAFVSHPAVAALGGLAGSVAGYRYGRDKD